MQEAVVMMDWSEDTEKVAGSWHVGYRQSPRIAAVGVLERMRG